VPVTARRDMTPEDIAAAETLLGGRPRGNGPRSAVWHPSLKRTLSRSATEFFSRGARRAVEHAEGTVHRCRTNAGATFRTIRARRRRKRSACSSALRALRKKMPTWVRTPAVLEDSQAVPGAPLRRRTLMARVRKCARAGSLPQAGRFHKVEYAWPRDRGVIHRCMGCTPIFRAAG